MCFGTLGQRDATSRETIQRFLAATPSRCLRVYDVNLRQSYWTEDVIRGSLTLANVLKLNDEELQVIAPMHDLEGSDETIIRSLLELYGLKLVALTRGSRGSLIITPDAVSEVAGVEVSIADTVGAGDAFTAAMVTGYLNSWSLEKTNLFANRVAAFVCSKIGAVPELPETVRGFSFVSETSCHFELFRAWGGLTKPEMTTEGRRPALSRCGGKGGIYAAPTARFKWPV